MNPTTEQVAQWAREAGAAKFYPDADASREDNYIVTQGFIARLVTRAMAEQAEADAKLCDATPPYPFRPSIEAAHAIRANAPKVTT